MSAALCSVLTHFEPYIASVSK